MKQRLSLGGGYHLSSLPLFLPRGKSTWRDRFHSSKFLGIASAEYNIMHMQGDCRGCQILWSPSVSVRSTQTRGVLSQELGTIETQSGGWEEPTPPCDRRLGLFLEVGMARFLRERGQTHAKFERDIKFQIILRHQCACQEVDWRFYIQRDVQFLSLIGSFCKEFQISHLLLQHPSHDRSDNPPP